MKIFLIIGNIILWIFTVIFFGTAITTPDTTALLITSIILFFFNVYLTLYILYSPRLNPHKTLPQPSSYNLSLKNQGTSLMNQTHPVQVVEYKPPFIFRIILGIGNLLLLLVMSPVFIFLGLGIFICTIIIFFILSMLTHILFGFPLYDILPPTVWWTICIIITIAICCRAIYSSYKS